MNLNNLVHTRIENISLRFSRDIEAFASISLENLKAYDSVLHA